VQQAPAWQTPIAERFTRQALPSPTGNVWPVLPSTSSQVDVATMASTIDMGVTTRVSGIVSGEGMPGIVSGMVSCACASSLIEEIPASGDITIIMGPVSGDRPAGLASSLDVAAPPSAAPGVAISAPASEPVRPMGSSLSEDEQASPETRVAIIVTRERVKRARYGMNGTLPCCRDETQEDLNREFQPP